jgi:hypothetical protein
MNNDNVEEGQEFDWRSIEEDHSGHHVIKSLPTIGGPLLSSDSKQPIFDTESRF